MSITNTLIPIAQIAPHPRNYRSHPDTQLAQLGASYTRFGQFRSVVVVARSDGSYTQVAGHGIVEAMKRNGATEVRVDVLSADTSPEDIEAILIADNTLGGGASDDEELLATMLKEQQDAGFDLASMGSDDETLRQMLDNLTQASTDEWSDALGGLPDGDKSPFKQMTFTLSNGQAELVEEALDLASEDKANFTDMGNQNSNGNALASIIKFYLDMGKGDASNE